jgi:DNA mismatch endonuclease (patch repair protein)
VFVASRVAVFVDGCFWHGCARHRRPAKTNRRWWAAKIARNIERDAQTNAALLAAGWSVVRVWEHSDPEKASRLIERLVRRGRMSRPSLDVV